jgi:hypothetical protein
MTEAAEERQAPGIPIPKTWWVKHGQLLAGCYPGDVDPDAAGQKLSALLEIGIRRFICLQPADEAGRDGKVFEPYLMPLVRLARQRDVGISWLRYPIPDMGVPDEEFMPKILECIDCGDRLRRAGVCALLGRARSDGHGHRLLARAAWPVRRGCSQGDRSASTRGSASGGAGGTPDG